MEQKKQEHPDHLAVSLKQPPGPPFLMAGKHTFAFSQRPIPFLKQLTGRYGDLCQTRLLLGPVVVLNHPDYVQQVLIEHAHCYDKRDPFFNTVRLLVGEGLASSDGEEWRSQRRLLQPLFHRQHLASFLSVITETLLASLERWDTRMDTGQPVEMEQAMHHLLLSILNKTIFTLVLGEQSETLIRFMDQAIAFVGAYARLPFPPLIIPTRRNRRFQHILHRLDEIIFGLITQREAQKGTTTDLLGMLLNARDPETGEGLSTQQIRDEVLTFFLGGSETTGSTLAWACFLLSQHPEVEARLHEEVARVLAGRLPTDSDLPHLTYTRMIVDEALRLYPAIWLLMRRARQKDTMGGYQIAQNSFVLWSPYLIHRHPDFWEEPERFQPERFRPGQTEKRHRGTYIPFSAGPRQCIGNHFALMQMVLILAVIAQRYHLELAPDHMVEPAFHTTLQFRNGLPLYLQARDKSTLEPKE